jgi:hypothetical protein
MNFSNPYVRRGVIVPVGLIIGYLLSTAPLVGQHLQVCDFMILFTVLLVMLFGW